MATTRQPHAGSLQFWPRKRAKRPYPRIRNAPQVKESKLLGFVGYKVGMTHLHVVENRKNSPNKGETVFMPVTIIECPPVKIAGIRLYKVSALTLKAHTEIWGNVDKELGRKVTLPKTKEAPKLDGIKPEEYADIRLLIYTQPKTTTLGKKKPELLEMRLGGSIAEKWNFAKENLGKEIPVQNVFQEGELVDIQGISTGKGFAGTTKRFGTSIRPRKTEKHKRGAGNLGPWNPAKVLYTVPQPGKMGFHQRTEYNKMIIKLSDKPAEVNQEGGIPRYGVVRNTYIMIKGSIIGTKKRAVVMKKPIRSKDKNTEAPAIEYISIASKQGR